MGDEVTVQGICTEMIDLYQTEHAGSAQNTQMVWMTEGSPSGVILDQHRPALVGQAGAGRLLAGSVINQAIGVLIGRGHTPEQADLELDARAGDADGDRHRAAVLILTTIPGSNTDLAEHTEV